MVNKKHGIELRPGTTIKGKWYQNEYIIERKLGSGTVGTVYLVKHRGTYAALKISEQQSSLTVEMNVLKALGKVQGMPLGPSLVEVDDFVTSTRTYTFYVMEYLKGESIINFVHNNGPEWIGVFMLQLLDDLERLHENGWVFGDLKTENLLVISSPSRVRWVDVGGTTKIGRAIKEYTEFYDRGYWGIGSRKAEPTYDLFALAMVFVTIAYPNRFPKTDTPQQTIFKKIDASHLLKPYHKFLKQAILGKYQTSREMKQAILKSLSLQSAKDDVRHDALLTRVPLLIEIAGIVILSSTFYLSSLLFP